jgi:DNA-directed RNA polymerase, mitochondrial
MRRCSKQTVTAVQRAIRDGTLRPVLDALNALQAVPWTINKRVLDVIRECAEQKVQVEGLPATVLSISDKERAWDPRAARKADREFLGARVLFREDVRTAERMAEYERFYTAMNLDWRGRVYSAPSFNFTREDRVRALFLFAEGEPIGDEGLYWLKVHTANCGDFETISKKPFSHRTAWVDRNLRQIEKYAEMPMKELGWTKADKPFLFLAACLELTSALRAGPSYVTRLPVSFDGSCSGLQHLCAMTRAHEGALVNLKSSPEPRDVYQVVADRVKERVENDRKYEDKRELVQICLKGGITRKLVKRNVMTYSYNSKVYGMTEQLREDTMDVLTRQVREGKLVEHPFGPDEGYAASKYLARHIYEAIEEVIQQPAWAMAFLQKLAKAMAHEGKSLRWTTPVGLPWINHYPKDGTKQVKLWLYNGGVRVPYTVKLAIGDLPDMDKSAAVNGVTPNFVHACDAAHLLRTVNAAATEGISSIVTVHDSFGCLPSRAARFRRLIREQFVLMFQEHDVLHEVFDRARADLGNPNDKRMPAGPPDKGSLDIELALDADYAFAQAKCRGRKSDLADTTQASLGPER